MALSQDDADRRSNCIQCGTVTETRMTPQKPFLLVVVIRGARASSETGNVSVLKFFASNM